MRHGPQDQNIKNRSGVRKLNRPPEAHRFYSWGWSLVCLEAVIRILTKNCIMGLLQGRLFESYSWFKKKLKKKY